MFSLSLSLFNNQLLVRPSVELLVSDHISIVTVVAVTVIVVIIGSSSYPTDMMKILPMYLSITLGTK